MTAVVVRLPSVVALQRNMRELPKIMLRAGEGIILPMILNNWQQSKGADGTPLLPISKSYAEYKRDVTTGPRGKPRPVIDMMLTGRMIQGMQAKQVRGKYSVTVTTSGAGAPAPLTKSQKRDVRKAGMTVSAFKASQPVKSNIEKLRDNVARRPNLMAVGKRMIETVTKYLNTEIMKGA